MDTSFSTGFVTGLVKTAKKESALAELLMSPVRGTVTAAKDIGGALADEGRVKMFGLGERIKSLAGKHRSDQLIRDVLHRAELQGKTPSEMQRLFKSMLKMRGSMRNMPEDTRKEFADLFESFGQGKAGQAYARAAVDRGVFPEAREKASNLPLLGLLGLAGAAAYSALRNRNK